MELGMRPAVGGRQTTADRDHGIAAAGRAPSGTL